MKLADDLRTLEPAVAEEAGRQFSANHPEWPIQHEEGRWYLGEEGVRRHIEFLAGAIESGSTSAFADYVKWGARVLHSRDISPYLLADTLHLMGKRLADALTRPRADMISAIIATAIAACLENQGPPPTASSEDESRLGRRVFLRAIIQGDRRAAQAVADDLLRRNYPILDIYAGLFEPCLKEVGRLWEHAQISIGVEHMATAVTQFVMTKLFSAFPFSEPVRGKAIISGIEGDQHQVGGNMISDALAIAGWDVRFLGSDVPQHGVLEVIGEHQPKLAGVSAALLSGIPSVIRLVHAVRERFPQTRIVVGGMAFGHLPLLWKEMGADGYAPGVKSAVEMVDGLFPPNR